LKEAELFTKCEISSIKQNKKLYKLF
jgi:hypothetical protein